MLQLSSHLAFYVTTKLPDSLRFFILSTNKSAKTINSLPVKLVYEYWVWFDHGDFYIYFSHCYGAQFLLLAEGGLPWSLWSVSGNRPKNGVV
ncbi:hypothetical protein DMC15_12505 [Vibrio sp. 11986-1-5]|nr:hypothetical protein DMC15_12505 [Vibrio sp. 11986-1-5]